MSNEAQNVSRALTALHTRETAYGAALEEEAEAEHVFKMKQADEFMLAEGPAEMRRATALQRCREEYARYLRAKASAAFLKVKVADAQAAVTARQSILRYAVQADSIHQRGGQP